AHASLSSLPASSPSCGCHDDIFVACRWPAPAQGKTARRNPGSPVLRPDPGAVQSAGARVLLSHRPFRPGLGLTRLCACLNVEPHHLEARDQLQPGPEEVAEQDAPNEGMHHHAVTSTSNALSLAALAARSNSRATRWAAPVARRARSCASSSRRARAEAKASASRGGTSSPVVSSPTSS